MPRWVKQTEATVVLVAPSTSVCQGAREVPCVSRPAAGLAQTTESCRNPLPSKFKWVPLPAVAIPGFHSLDSCLTNASRGAFLSGQFAGSDPPSALSPAELRAKLAACVGHEQLARIAAEQ